MFGASNFAFKNIRRKADARAYPSRLEFGLKRGIVPPPSLNNGQQVDLLLGRIAAPYYAVAHVRRAADAVPRRRRRSADAPQPVVLDRGSLATAMRATMSLPLIFPPVRVRRARAGGRRRDEQRAGRRRPRDGRAPRHRRSTSATCRTATADQLLDVRPGRRDDRRDDARQHEGGDRAGRRHHQRAAGGLRIARLAPQRRADRRKATTPPRR